MNAAPQIRIVAAGAFSALLVCLAMFIPGQSVALSPPLQKAEVFFSNGGRIVSMQADGSDRKVLTRKGKVTRPPFQFPAGDRLPKVSPDGTRILFFRETDRFPDDSTFSNEGKTMLANADGSDAQEILKPKPNVTYREASWMPDGSIVAAKRVTKGSKRGFQRQSSVVTLNTDGSGERTIFKLKPHVQENRKQDLATNFLPIEIVPSLDGQKLLVTIQNGYRNDGRTLEVVTVADGKRRVVAGKAYSGSWSPDGQRIVFASDKGTKGKSCVFQFDCVKAGDLFIANADGSGRTNLTRTNADETSPVWAPDGQSIVFSSNRQNPSESMAAEIYSIRPDGQCLTWLTNGSPSSITPALGRYGSSEAGACGATMRAPMLEGRPPRKTKTSVGPRLWLGPESRGALYSGGIDFFGVSMDTYGDCGNYYTRECKEQEMTASLPVCLAKGFLPELLTFLPRKMNFTPRRGVKVVQEKYEGKTSTVVFSGGSIILLGGVFGELGLAEGKSATARQQLGQVDQLRQVGELVATRDLPPFMLPRGDLRRARKVVRVVKRTGSVKVAAKRLGMGKWRVRAHLGFERKARRFGPVTPMNCPKNSGLLDLIIGGFSSDVGSPRALAGFDFRGVRDRIEADLPEQAKDAARKLAPLMP